MALVDNNEWARMEAALLRAVRRLPPDEQIGAIQALIEEFEDEHPDLGLPNVPRFMFNRVNAFILPEDKFRTLKKADVETKLEDSCGICCDNHCKIHCITTQCGHCFGGRCFKRWEDTRRKARLSLTCPMCNTVVTTITNYLPRKNYKPTKK